jgi:hypothetical protein
VQRSSESTPLVDLPKSVDEPDAEDVDNERDDKQQESNREECVVFDGAHA